MEAYLRAWADSNSKLLAYRRRGDNARPAGVGDVAVVCGIYGAGELGDACEKMYRGVEDEWPNLRRDLIAKGDLQDDQRRLFAMFAALQLVRTEKHVERMNFTTKIAATTAERPVPKDAVRDFLRDLDGGAEPDDSEVEAAWSFVCGELAMYGTSTGAVKRSASVDAAVTRIAPSLETMTWTVHKFRGAPLISSDSPVHSWRRRAQDVEPRGIGIETADEVRFPLSPSALLIMHRGPRKGSTPQWSSRKPVAINTEIARQCHQFIIGTRQSMVAIDQLALSDWPPRLRFRMLGNDMFHMYVGDSIGTVHEAIRSGVQNRTPAKPDEDALADELIIAEQQLPPLPENEWMRSVGGQVVGPREHTADTARKDTP
ncbi:DUF4238 domain-containing protein [Mycobacterium sp. Lab-001]|uniref:DUF4238 domain-containing protein n=1 Tax=Mycobacterium sp. Lab-001 TaxID=3410136 RepID=UPI003D16B40F